MFSFALAFLAWSLVTQWQSGAALNPPPPTPRGPRPWHPVDAAVFAVALIVAIGVGVMLAVDPAARDLLARLLP
ncbi:hypothetical protein [Nonomuraea rubra]|uniref:hypothetical protein n=1 Tax=Nonomuraea rubra TaxID=46180 RepID=UPI003409E14E